MADLKLGDAYKSTGESIEDLFSNVGEGFFVPPYQREYTWEEDNINQLFDDFLFGIRELTAGDDDVAATFLGTVILSSMADTEKVVKAGEEKARPTAVKAVIDGQQRMATLAIIAIHLEVRIRALYDKLPDHGPYGALREQRDNLLDVLQALYAVKIGRGAEPPRKPRIIRGKEDRWTFEGDDSSYVSPVSQYVANFIRGKNLDEIREAISPVEGARVRGNVALIEQWLDGICQAHVPQTLLYGQFPVGAAVVTERLQKYVLGYVDDDIRKVVSAVSTDPATADYWAAASYQVLLFCYYLLKRCGVTRLTPTRIEWGFDMFQALNSTGTPLTAMETFVPQVMQAEVVANNEWEASPSRALMDDIDELFATTVSNEQKTRRTNELLGTLALCLTGEKLGNKFSAQSRWMTKKFGKDAVGIQDKREFLKRLRDIAHYYYYAWYMEEGEQPYVIRGLEGEDDGPLASLLVQFLKDASSQLSAPVLARFYSQFIAGEASAGEFIEACKACAAFFCLWRSSLSTSGLDSVYRRYFAGSASEVKVDANNWSRHPKPVASDSLKRYFSDVLASKAVRSKADWIKASDKFLLYTELKTICRFVLFVSANDQVVDKANPGLTQAGKSGACSLLTLERWRSRDHRTLEHVAPQSPASGHSWDGEIYADGRVQRLGNLILLSTDLNKLVDNKGWLVKFLHYSHVGLREMSAIERLAEDAKKQGVVLSKKATATLSKTKYNCTIEPILAVGEGGQWNAELIDKRTDHIKALAWDVLDQWLRT